jgi:hypothetical protein
MVVRRSQLPLTGKLFGQTIQIYKRIFMDKYGRIGVTLAALGAELRGDRANFIVASTPGGIEAQEAAGQASLCREASRLPVQLNRRGSNVSWEDIEREWGIQRGEVTDKIFYSVQIPAGWKLRPSDHSMWSHLIDENGSERASIFFKAAFYDYQAHMSVDPRYHLQFKSKDRTEFDLDGETKGYDVRDRRTGEIIFVSPWTNYEGAGIAGTAFLDENYPDHKNPFAYWVE